MATLRDNPDVKPMDGIDRNQQVILSDSDFLNPDLPIGTQGIVSGFIEEGENDRREVKAIFKVGSKHYALSPALLSQPPEVEEEPEGSSEHPDDIEVN